MSDTFTPRLNLVLPDFNISPWHDKVNSNFRLMDAAIYSILGLSGIKGPFLNSTTVLVGEKYYDAQTSVFYEVVTSYVTSPFPTTFAQERVLYPTRWKVLEVATIAGAIDIVLDAQDVVLGVQTAIGADRVVVAADKATVAADKGVVATDKGIVATDKGIVASDKATVIAERILAQAAAAAAASSAALVPSFLAPAGNANKFNLINSAATGVEYKSVAEVKTILGLGSAAYVDTTTFATAAQGTLADQAMSTLLIATQAEAEVAVGLASRYPTMLNVTQQVAFKVPNRQQKYPIVSGATQVLVDFGASNSLDDFEIVGSLFADSVTARTLRLEAWFAGLSAWSPLYTMDTALTATLGFAFTLKGKTPGASGLDGNTNIIQFMGCRIPKPTAPTITASTIPKSELIALCSTGGGGFTQLRFTLSGGFFSFGEVQRFQNRAVNAV